MQMTPLLNVNPRAPITNINELESGDRVAILLCTYNGAAFIKDQINSIEEQTFSKWVLWVSDDGSDDHTLDILNQLKSRHPAGQVNIIAGPRNGSTKNFQSLACNTQVSAKWYAFCDQDDIWDSNKLTRAINWLKLQSTVTPSLYCSTTTLVDEQNTTIGKSVAFKKPPSFRNALVQNIASGNTMVFNQAAMDLIRHAGLISKPVVHDWWLYLLVTGSGGNVYYDHEPTVRYRQHSANLIGAGSGLCQRLSRLLKIFRGQYKGWNDQNLDALSRNSQLLTKENQYTLDEFKTTRTEKNPVRRALRTKRLGLYRQTTLGNASLYLALLFGKY